MRRCVLLLGATGRTGGSVLTQLLERGMPVRAIVRSAERLPVGTQAAPLVEDEPSGYRTDDGLVASLFRADKTRMANVAHFMAELATDEVLWQRWRGQMPVIVDAETVAAH